MTTPYRIGYCPQCGAQIMVRDAAGRWSSYKPNYQQIDLMFGDGLKMRSTICSDCMSNPDYAKLKEAVLAEGSQACNKKIRDRIKFTKDNVERGEIVSHQIKQPILSEE